MPTIEIDMEAREILRSWKRRFAEQGRKQDYSEAIRSMNDMKPKDGLLICESKE